MTIKEASESFAIPPQALREMLAADLLPGRKVDGTWHVDGKILHTALALLRSLRNAVTVPSSKPVPASPPARGQDAYKKTAPAPPSAGLSWHSGPWEGQVLPQPGLRRKDRERARTVWDDFRQGLSAAPVPDSEVDLWMMALRQLRRARATEPPPPPPPQEQTDGGAHYPWDWH